MYMDADTTTERVADVTRRLLAGERLRCAQIAREYNMSYPGAYSMMLRLSRVLGLAHHRHGWYIVGGEYPEPWN